MKSAHPLVAAALGALLVAGCRTPAPPPSAADPELAKLSRAATLAHRRAGGERARPLFRAALDRAEALGDTAAAGALAYNLAICLAEIGEVEAALDMARAARRDLERSGKTAAEPIGLEAALLFSQGRPEAAERAAAEAAEAARAARRGDLEASARALLAEMAAERGDAAAAAREWAAARRAAGRAPAPAVEARLEHAAGRIAESHRAFAEAAEAYAREARAWGRAGMAPRVAPAFLRAARAAKDGGRIAEAVERILDAARSWAGQGDRAAARRALERIAEVPDSSLPERSRAERAALEARLAAPDGDDPLTPDATR